MRLKLRHPLIVLSAMLLVACSSTDFSNTVPEKRVVGASYLAQDYSAKENDQVSGTAGQDRNVKPFVNLESLTSTTTATVGRVEAARTFATVQPVTIAADNIPLSELVHMAFGEVLKVNYVMSNDVKSDPTRVTLNISKPVEAIALYQLLAETLNRYQVTVDFDNDTFFLQKAALSKAKATIGIGADINSVPTTSGQILQVIPVKYGIKVSIERTVRELIDASVNVDFEQSAIFVMGDRSNVLRAIELIQLLDVPSNRGKNIGLLSLTYISVAQFLEEAIALLNSEGVSAGVGQDVSKNVLLVPLNHIGAIAVFATDEDLLNRVKYWAGVLDVPTQGENEQYFIYTPKYARAKDVGDSVGQLLAIGRPRNERSTQSTGENAREVANNAPTQSKVVNGSDVSFVVDERSNSLIFSTTGSQYQTLLPLLHKLDVLPKQVLLEVMIAEVTLTDDFKFGVEFALRNSSEFSATTLGGLGASTIGGLNFAFLNNGIEGSTEATASFFRENQYVNIISNPTILVRDGVSASISVGTSIPVQSGTIVDQGVQTTSVDYRKTGVDVTVTPTVNAQGVVIMNIAQSISNTVDTTATSPTPSIFERSIDTEAVVNSGQTVILGGLISEDTTLGDSKVPLLGDLPLVGNLFKGKNDSSSKTELVMLVTPKVIETNDQWEKLIEDFQSGLQNVRIVK